MLDLDAFERNLQRMAGLTPGVYTVTHPYGSFTFTVNATGSTVLVNGQAFRAEDPIAPSPGVYFPPEMRAGVLTGIGPFLTSAAGLVTDPASGHVYIGDPRVASAVVGSPTGNNFFRIDGPNVGGPGVNYVQTTLFNLSGKVFTLYDRPDNASVASLVEAYPARFLGWIFLNPRNNPGVLDELEQWRSVPGSCWTWSS